MASSPTLEQQLPGVMESGLITNKAAQFNGSVSLTTTTTAAALSPVATTDSVTADPTTNAPAGWMKISVAGADRYVPFYTLSGS